MSNDTEILIDKDDFLEQLKNSKVVNHTIVKPTLVSYTLYPFIALSMLAAVLLTVSAIGVWIFIVLSFTLIWFVSIGPLVLVNKLYKRLTQKEEKSE